ncbi:WD40/YVTN repeat-like-containing domain,WD40-repeat-containing domain,WD40 repeat, conserved site,Six- [Cinara cedri]|uniref:WD repeat-containing protein on Y chromosome n=1 Tax=Cinara cedri TaxID=506608 RepID=A0A5E4LZX4_9HEMI|nr:WD40/YVTN repeat-like-containing domain,WD40-repeat-containing domain,WD40 repeat, conserved site,Six- [Cinara cedri]
MQNENTEEINGMKIYLTKLAINDKTLEKIREDFQLNENGTMNVVKFREMLESKYKIFLLDDDFKSMFAKIDVKKEGYITFLQFVTYLSTESELKRKRNEQNSGISTLKLTPKLLPNKPIVDNKNKLHKITEIVFSTLMDRKGKYVVISEMGDILVYTSELNWKVTHKCSKPCIKITCILTLADFNVVCLFTEDQTLKFYVSTKFELCLSITDWPHTIKCLAYSQNTKSGSMMAVGDRGGTVHTFKFPVSEKKNPFRGRVGTTGAPRSFSYTNMTFGEANEYSLTTINLVRFPRLHPAGVEQMEFCDSGKFLVSISYAPSKSIAYCWVGAKATKKRDKPTPINRYVSVPDRLFCVCSAGKGLVAVGGVDLMVRLLDFDECFSDGNPKSAQLLGHDTAIHHLFYNYTNCRLYSVSADRTVKIWDVNSIACVLTFVKAAVMTKAIGLKFVPTHFNQCEQKIVMAVGDEFLTIKCADTATDNSVVESDSHDEAVLKTMYCRLFRVLISVSTLDSTIAVWNPFTGQQIHKWSMAHNKQVYGETIPVEITAATLDPSGGLLVTGAVNGTVHMWDPNRGTCLNRLHIPSRNRISDIVWLPNKVLITSWDGKVTEFNEPLLVSSGKVWLSSHDDAALSACGKLPSLFVTTSLAGEIGFWRLETGQLIKIHKARLRSDSSMKHSKSSTSASKMSTVSPSSISYNSRSSRSIADGANPAETREETYRRLNIKYTPKGHFAAVASMFLRARPDAERVGTLFISVRNGMVQLWSTYKVPKYVAQFTAIHLDDDYVTAMASDPKNDYLFTSFYSGYVKTWHIANFGRPVTVVQPLSMPKLRQRFPFLLASMFIGRAERAAIKNPSGPLLFSSYKAHVQCIRHIDYIDEQELLVTSSADRNIRIWTLAGHYVGTLGSRWPSISRIGVVNMTEFIIPSEVRRQASFTTIKVLSDGVNSALRSPELWTKLVESREQRKLEGAIDDIVPYGTNCPQNPLSGLEFMDSKITTIHMEPTQIKINGPRVAISKYLPIANLAIIKKLEVSDIKQTMSKNKKGVKFRNLQSRNIQFSRN